MKLSYYIAKKFKEYRESNGIKQGHVSKELKVAQNTLSRIELNLYAIKIDMVIELCKFYNIDFIDFMKICYEDYLNDNLINYII